MLTCNKNFVDLTIWSWTCTKLNIMLHQSLEEERERAKRQGDGSDWNQTNHILRPDRTGFNWTERVCSAWNPKELNWTESQLCTSKVGTQAGLLRAFFCQTGRLFEQNRSVGRRFGVLGVKLLHVWLWMRFDALSYILKKNESAFTLPFQPQFSNLKTKLIIFFLPSGADRRIPAGWST